MTAGQIIARLKGLIQSGAITRDTDVYTAEGNLTTSIDVDGDSDLVIYDEDHPEES